MLKSADVIRNRQTGRVLSSPDLKGERVGDSLRDSESRLYCDGCKVGKSMLSIRECARVVYN